MKAFFVSALLAAALAAAPGAAWSQQAPGGPLRLGIASDLNGPYASLGGKGALLGALVIGQFRGVDIRTMGSGNAGGTNALRTQGLGFAAVTVVIDVGKGWLAAAWVTLKKLTNGL